MTKLIFFIGHAGCGKTTISKIAAEHLKTNYLDRDTIGSIFVEKMLLMKGLSPNDRDSQTYHKEIRDLEYKTMFAIAAENLKLGIDTILVSPFTKEVSNQNWIKEFLNENQLSNINIKVVSVYLSDPEVQRGRISERNTSRDQWKLDNWDVYKERLKKIEVSWSNAQTLYFDNSFELTAEQINSVISFLKTT
ncbi:AAA family ATPase [Priestia aryabhattai]